MGKIAKGVTCSVQGCGEAALRSLSKDKIGDSGLQTSGERRIYLCRNHYKQWKKSTKKDRELERIKYG